jgi:peptidoglycan/xylan/chitin deacetylase (PgdA/CDA1 family)
LIGFSILRRFVLCLALLLGTQVLADVDRPRFWGSPAAGGSASGDPEVLFTFDDGPDLLRTPKILDTLRLHHVQAVFFIVGRHLEGKRNQERMPPILRRLVSEGHIAGNHTVGHVHLCSIPQAQGNEEIDRNAAMIREATGLPEVKFFRAPYGDRCIRLENMLAVRKLKHLHWDIDPREWLTLDAEQTEQHVINRIAEVPEGGRAVVLLHDTHGTTVTALPKILAWIGKENERRRTAGIRPIRIIGPADVALERLPPDLLPLLDETADLARDLVPDVLGRLLLPLTSSTALPTARRDRPLRPGH